MGSQAQTEGEPAGKAGVRTRTRTRVRQTGNRMRLRRFPVDMHRPGPNAASKNNRGQLNDRQHSTKMIYDLSPGAKKTQHVQVGTGERGEQHRGQCTHAAGVMGGVSPEVSGAKCGKKVISVLLNWR